MNINTGKTITKADYDKLMSPEKKRWVNLDELNLSNSEMTMLQEMNRKQRRAWLKDNKKKSQKNG